MTWFTVWYTLVFPPLTPDSNIYLLEKGINTDLQSRVVHSVSLLIFLGASFSTLTLSWSQCWPFYTQENAFWHFVLSFTLSLSIIHIPAPNPITDSESHPATVHWKARATVACMLALRLTEEHLCLKTASRNHFSMATALAKWAVPFICLFRQTPNQFLFLHASSLKSSLHRATRMTFQKHKSVHITSLSCLKSYKGFLFEILTVVHNALHSWPLTDSSILSLPTYPHSLGSNHIHQISSGLSQDICIYGYFT